MSRKPSHQRKVGVFHNRMGIWSKIKRERESTHSLDLTGIDLEHADARGDELLAQGAAEAVDGGLGGAVDAAAGVGLAAGDAADVDDVAVAAVGAAQKDGQDRLRHVDEARHVGADHGVHVLLGDLGGPRDALDEAAVELFRQPFLDGLEIIIVP